MTFNPIRGGMTEDSHEEAHKLLLSYGIKDLQAKAGFLPKEETAPPPQTFKDFIKESKTPRTITSITQWMTRGTDIGTMNPSVVTAITGLSRYEQIWGKKHPIAQLMQYEWYRRVLEYWEFEDEPNEFE